MAAKVFPYDIVVGIHDHSVTPEASTSTITSTTTKGSSASILEEALKPFSPEIITPNANTVLQASNHSTGLPLKRLAGITVEAFNLESVSAMATGEHSDDGHKENKNNHISSSPPPQKLAFPVYAYVGTHQGRAPVKVASQQSWTIPAGVLHLFRDPKAIEGLSMPTPEEQLSSYKMKKKGVEVTSKENQVEPKPSERLGHVRVAGMSESAGTYGRKDRWEGVEESAQGEWKQVRRTRERRDRGPKSVQDTLGAREPVDDSGSLTPSHHVPSTATLSETQGNTISDMAPERSPLQTDPEPPVEIPQKFDRLLSILSIPSYLSPLDIANYLAPFASSITHIRLFRDSLVNRTIAILLFTTRERALQFFRNYNGKRFHFMEPETCQLAVVRKVRIYDVAKVPMWALPRELMVAAVAASGETGEKTGEDGVRGSDEWIELPTCPVCLERLDVGASGLLTIACQHTFHCKCLRKWGESSCPVCRYTQRAVFPPSTIQAARHLGVADPASLTTNTAASTSGDHHLRQDSPAMEDDTRSRCLVCDATANLWICLLCGHIGCGRYHHAHAKGHFQSTNHLYALEIDTQRVWDYVGDGYVHRLVQNSEDGKLVELPAPCTDALAPLHSSDHPSEALSHVDDDYREDLLVAATTESLSTRFEADAIDQAKTYLTQLELQRQKFESQLTETRSRLSALTTIESHQRKRADRFEKLSRDLGKQLKDESAINHGLIKKVHLLEEKNKEQEKEVTELKDQLKDLMFHVAALQRMHEDKELQQELWGASVERVPEADATQRGRQRRRGRR